MKNMFFIKKFASLSFLLIAIVFFCSSPVFAATVTGTDFPYGRIQLKLPPVEHPFPGLGPYYSALSKGVETMMWNPASLGKTKLAEGTFSLMSDSTLSDYNYKYNSTDRYSELGGQSTMHIGYFFTGDRTTTVVATRENTAHAIYSTKGTGVNLKQALRVNEWFSFGFISRGDVGGTADMLGSFPMITRFDSNFKSSTVGISSKLTVGIDTSGYATLTITPEAGVSYTKQLDQPLWSGFLNQSSVVPVTVLFDAKNDISASAPYTFGGAAKVKDLSLGIGFTPIAANMNINNIARAVVNEGTPDILFYQPNIDPSNEQSILNWAQDPNQYGTEVGYKKSLIEVPTGQVVGEGRYQGFYQSSGARADIGMQYDFNDNITGGLVFENAGGTILNFRGQGVSSYVNSRIGTMEIPSLDPTQPLTWTPFTDTYSTVEGTQKYYLEEQLTYELPKKMRVGVVFRKPLLIAIDYEMNNTPIKYKYESSGQPVTATISNINTLRFGVEAQVFKLPSWFRISTALMFKPTVSNLEANIQEQVDKYFKYGVLPISFELGDEINFWGTIVGLSGGVNGTPLFSLLQFDALNVDMSKVVYYDLYVIQGPWQISYIMNFDSGSTLSAYGNRLSGAGSTFDTSYLRYCQTLTVSYRF